MKTKTFLLVCLFMGFGLARLSAQNGKNGTGTDVYDFKVPFVVTIPVFCDGLLVDLISTSVDFTVKVRDHYGNGEFIWEKSTQNHIVLTSEMTGELFVQNGAQEKVWQPVMGMDYLHFNVIGNEGNHYLVHIVIDLSTGMVVDAHGSCH